MLICDKAIYLSLLLNPIQPGILRWSFGLEGGGVLPIFLEN